MEAKIEHGGGRTHPSDPKSDAIDTTKFPIFFQKRMMTSPRKKRLLSIPCTAGGTPWSVPGAA
jgi:hypothetical protein